MKSMGFMAIEDVRKRLEKAKHVYVYVKIANPSFGRWMRVKNDEALALLEDLDPEFIIDAEWLGRRQQLNIGME